jgi:hypothetical protein
MSYVAVAQAVPVYYRETLSKGDPLTMADPKKDSKMQVQQEEENKHRSRGEDTNGDGNIDKKLDGPNFPAE